MVERDDAMRLGARDVERLRDYRHGRLRHVTEGLLQVMEDRQHRAVLAAMGGDDLSGAILVPVLVNIPGGQADSSDHNSSCYKYGQDR